MNNTEGLKSGILSTAQQEVYDMLAVEKLTVKQCAIRRKTSRQAIYRIKRALVEMGYLTKDLRVVKRVEKQGVGSQHVEQWELHGCAWRVEILEGQNEQKYKRIVAEGAAQVRVYSCTVELYRDCLIVYYDGFFRSDAPDGCIIKSWEYLWRVLGVLENDYQLILRKDRHSNIRRFRGHFPRLNDEVAQASDGEALRVYAEDGKIRFSVDWSKKRFPEAEFLHSRHGPHDARKYEDFIRDIVEGDGLRLSSLAANSAATTAQINALASELRELARAVRAGQEMQNTVLAIIKENYEGKRDV